LENSQTLGVFKHEHLRNLAPITQEEIDSINGNFFGKIPAGNIGVILEKPEIEESKSDSEESLD
jgi:hypothetical protein